MGYDVEAIIDSRTGAFSQADEKSGLLITPGGELKIGLETKVNKELGTIGLRSLTSGDILYNKIYCMSTTPEHDERIAKMTFASVYPHYITKIESKGRTKEELHQVIKWLTSFDDKKLQEQIDAKVTFKTFFQKAKLNPNAHLITGVICGYRIEEIGNSLTQRVRYLDKLVDELAKGKKMEKILRKA